MRIVDGNHENFPELDRYFVDEWNGGKVHMIESDIIHLMRGQVFEIEGKKIFTFGGAFSVDREQRVENATWFREEVPTQEEYDEAWKNLEKAGFEVDFIVTHTAPYEIIGGMFGFGSFDDALEQTKEFQRIAENTEFKQWFFGHFHMDEELENFRCLYEEIIDVADYE